MPFDWWTFVVPAACAGTLMPLAIRARSIGHDQVGGVQKVHDAPTSRLGGAVIFVAFLAALGVAHSGGDPAMRAAMPLAVAALPVVMIGLVEDLTRAVRPRYRLLAAAVSAALAGVYAGGVVPRIDVAFVDRLLAYAWFALPLTWFMVVGACNAINLIDGAHGLAAGTALIMFGGIALAAHGSGDATTLAPTLAVMGALAGFMAWNYPGGRVFLGDAGAYFVGFMYAELAIQLVARNAGISAWYVIVLAGYPIVDTLFSMYRRGVVRGLPLMSPDGLHLHSLVYRRIAVPLEMRAGARVAAERRIGERRGHAATQAAAPLVERRRGERRQGERDRRLVNLRRANARVAPRLWVHGALCFALAVLFHDNTPALWGCLLVYAAFYVSRYRSLVRFGQRHARPPAPVEREADAAKPMR